MSATALFAWINTGSTQKLSAAGSQWLTPIILATQEAEIRRMATNSS
jgi:hypothetical protein